MENDSEKKGEKRKKKENRQKIDPDPTWFPLLSVMPPYALVFFARSTCDSCSRLLRLREPIFSCNQACNHSGVLSLLISTTHTPSRHLFVSFPSSVTQSSSSSDHSSLLPIFLVVRSSRCAFLLSFSIMAPPAPLCLWSSTAPTTRPDKNNPTCWPEPDLNFWV